ncbi:MAG: hypothetical protein IT441_09590 [Phycisphaeraceae bacterium]|nr:hypothetical protein [Phycisphaeraceae bacterium]
MTRSRNTSLLLALILCILAVAGVMIAAVLLAGQKSVLIFMPPPTPTPAADVAPTVAAAAVPTTPTAPPATPLEITVKRVAAAPAPDNVFDAFWEKITAVDVPLVPQQMTSPMLEQQTVASITVQAVRDDQRMVWRLSWPAARPAMLADTNHFPDAAAMMFPMADGAPFTMGAKGQPVRLLHWKAVWQKDVDEGFADLDKLYPNSWTDLYWFAPHPGPVPLKEIIKDPRALQFLPLLAAGNPMSNPARKQPVEELAAEGFGTATTLADSPAHARGVWKDGRWTVVIDRQLAPEDALSARLQSSTQNLVSFAVWDGSAGNRGGRKQYCTWLPMRLEP